MGTGVRKVEYRRLPLACECGGAPKNISGIGFSSTHELVIHWRCPRCRKNLCVVMPLSECWRTCFTEGSATPAIANGNLAMDTPDDRRFLHSIGVRYSDE